MKQKFREMKELDKLTNIIRYFNTSLINDSTSTNTQKNSKDMEYEQHYQATLPH